MLVFFPEITLPPSETKEEPAGQNGVRTRRGDRKVNVRPAIQPPATIGTTSIRPSSSEDYQETRPHHGGVAHWD
jgi:hypothetical protein